VDGVSGLVIPVREADTIVRQRLLQTDPALLPQDGSVAAHVTLLAPFVEPDGLDEGVLDELGRFFADITPFRFELTEVCQFPGGPTYLSPEPASFFRRLTVELSRLFPEFPPYGGAFDDVVPHLTVPLPAGETAGDLAEQLAGRLPLTAHATEACLLWSAPHQTHSLAGFPFGIAAA
jgi:2'-5' RNA ligase superfamily